MTPGGACGASPTGLFLSPTFPWPRRDQSFPSCKVCFSSGALPHGWRWRFRNTISIASACRIPPPPVLPLLFQALFSGPPLLLTPQPGLPILVNGNSSLPTGHIRIFKPFIIPLPISNASTSRVGCTFKIPNLLEQRGTPFLPGANVHVDHMTYQLENQTRGQEKGMRVLALSHCN